MCHRLQIINLGKRLTDTATLEVDWPKETEQGKWLLYLTKISSTGVEHVECTPKSEINPLKLVSQSFCTYSACCRPESKPSTKNGNTGLKGGLYHLIENGDVDLCAYIFFSVLTGKR